MIELQCLAGMRPTEPCAMRTIDINTSGSEIRETPCSETSWSTWTGNASSSLGHKLKRFSGSGSGPTSNRFCSHLAKRWRNAGPNSGARARARLQPSQFDRSKKIPKPSARQSVYLPKLLPGDPQSVHRSQRSGLGAKPVAPPCSDEGAEGNGARSVTVRRWPQARQGD